MMWLVAHLGAYRSRKLEFEPSPEPPLAVRSNAYRSGLRGIRGRQDECAVGASDGR